MNKKRIVKRTYNVIVVLLLMGALAYVASRFYHGENVEYTDDAQVQRHITPIHTRVQGFIKEIRFEEYQHVKKGDTLIVIEDAEYRLKLAQAEAALKGTRVGSEVISAGINTTAGNVAAAAGNVEVASAGIEEARVEMENTRTDFERYAELLKQDAVTQQQYDNAKTRYDAAVTRYDAARARQAQAQAATQATSMVTNEQKQRLSQNTSNISVAQEAIKLARLNLSYTVIVATADGVMGRKDIHEGQLVQPGQLLGKIVDDEQVWVIANYRETQLPHITVGKSVVIRADALPGMTYKGVVESISPATGAAYSSVAADNATGNFVKVEQRVPIRIALRKQNAAADIAKLRAGLNVETEVQY